MHSVMTCTSKSYCVPIGLFVALGFVSACGTPPDEVSDSAQQASAAGVTMAPIFEVDPFWPAPLPNHWVTGSTIGIAVDAQDNVWTIHRPGSVEDNFRAADLTAAEAIDDEVEPSASRGAARAEPIGACCSVSITRATCGWAETDGTIPRCSSSAAAGNS